MSERKIKREIQKYLETNENGNITYQNVWDAGKAVLRGKFIVINIDIKKKYFERRAGRPSCVVLYSQMASSSYSDSNFIFPASPLLQEPRALRNAAHKHHCLIAHQDHPGVYSVARARSLLTLQKHSLLSKFPLYWERQRKSERQGGVLRVDDGASFCVFSCKAGNAVSSH